MLVGLVDVHQGIIGYTHQSRAGECVDAKNALAATSTEHLCDSECGDDEHPRDGRIVFVPEPPKTQSQPLDTEAFRTAVVKAFKRAHLDSNDREIEQLQHAVSEACHLLGVDENALRQEADEWAVRRGHAL